MAPTERADGEEHRLIAAGFGGQGILTLGRLLCMAGMSEGRRVTYLPSYGSEVRGGTANCQVVISPGTIYSPLVEVAHSLIIFNQLSYERFRERLRPDGLMLVNSSGVEMDGLQGPPEGRLLALPAAERAARMGNVRVGNVIMLGAFTRLAGLVGAKSCREALQENFGRAGEEILELNLKAFDEGRRMAEDGTGDQ